MTGGSNSFGQARDSLSLLHPLWCERKGRCECESLGSCAGRRLMLCCFLLGLKLGLWLSVLFFFLPFTNNFYPSVLYMRYCLERIV